MINHKDLKTDNDWEMYRMRRNNHIIRVEFPDFDLYLKEINEPLKIIIRDFAKTFIINNIKAKSLARSRDLEAYIYWFNVTCITENNKHKVTGIENRSIEYVLDHIIPISYGFKHNINPEIIGNEYNLQMLTNKENLFKSNKITDIVKDRLSHFKLTNSKPIERNVYEPIIKINFKCHPKYKNRIVEGYYLKYFDIDNNIIHSELLQSSSVLYTETEQSNK